MKRTPNFDFMVEMIQAGKIDEMRELWLKRIDLTSILFIIFFIFGTLFGWFLTLNM